MCACVVGFSLYFCSRRAQKSCCTSVNEVVCHGIPDSRSLKEGDIVNVDITAFVVNRGSSGSDSVGYHGVSTTQTMTRPAHMSSTRTPPDALTGRCLHTFDA